jgi:ATP-binding cassette subfamily B multidrug efflux pump
MTSSADDRLLVDQEDSADVEFGSEALAARRERERAEGESRTEQKLREFHEEYSLGKAYDARMVRRLWAFVRPHQALMWLALGISTVTAASVLARPLIMRWAIDQGVMERDGAILARGGMLLVVVVVLEQIFVFVQTYSLQVVGARSVADLRRHIFKFIHSLRVGYFDRQPVGRLVTRVTNDTDAVLELFSAGVLNAFGDLIRIAGVTVIMVTLDWKLAAVAFAAVPPAAILLLLVRGFLRQAFRDVRAKTARMNANMDEQVSGMTVVQAYRRQNAAEREFDAINTEYRNANLRAIKYDSMQDAAIDMVMSVCIAAIVVMLGFQPVSFGTLVAFNLYVFLFFEPIAMLSQRYTLLQSAMAGAERLFGLLDTKGQEDAPAVKLEPSTAPVDPTECLALDRVTFAYKPGLDVLHDVSLTARRGEKIALVGPTGAGKSTVASLMLRLYDVRDGAVRVEGRDVRAWNHSDLRRRFAVVPQDVFLFPGTLATNIALADAPDLDRVRAVLEQMGSFDLFNKRPEGLATAVQERGANFSAGERQLIAFARALYSDAQVLVLDEATASVDSDTEARLQRALEVLMRERTAIIIAHRLSTIRAADRIVVFHQGRIVEQGSHDELLEHGGLFARLYSLQQAAERGVAE